MSRMGRREYGVALGLPQARHPFHGCHVERFASQTVGRVALLPGFEREGYFLPLILPPEARGRCTLSPTEPRP